MRLFMEREILIMNHFLYTRNWSNMVFVGYFLGLYIFEAVITI